MHGRTGQAITVGQAFYPGADEPPLPLAGEGWGEGTRIGLVDHPGTGHPPSALRAPSPARGGRTGIFSRSRGKNGHLSRSRGRWSPSSTRDATAI